MRKGPFNAVMDPTEVGAGSALLEVSEAVKKSGTYDVWSSRHDDEDPVGETFQISSDVKVEGRRYHSQSRVRPVQSINPDPEMSIPEG